MIWLAFSLALLGFYVLLIATYYVGWKLIKIPAFTNCNNYINFTVLVPARNESAQILACLTDLRNQQYVGNFEVIVLDDFSTDNTADLVTDFIIKHQLPHFRVIKLAECNLSKSYKKAAITYGVQQAKYNHILLTDADCLRQPNWLNTFNNFVQLNASKMVYAPVIFSAKNWFEKFQAIEFAGLVAIGAAAIRLKKPNMCSAANLMFTKDVFVEVDGYVGNDLLASGDDEFLLHKVFKRYPKQVHFLKHADALVTTSANKSLNELTEQRKRWVSKSTKYQNRYITLILVLAYLFNFSILYHVIFQPMVGLGMLAVKTLIEALLLFSALSFLKKPWYILLLPFAEVFHIFYVLVIGILGNVTTFNWKGRNLN